MTMKLTSAMQAKAQASRLRENSAEHEAKIGHAKSLELVAHQHGFRDWNTMLAAIENGPPKEWKVGDKLSGTYLSKRFTAYLVAIEILPSGWLRLELQLDDAIDVVASDGFSNYRTRLHGVIGSKGYSKEQTSDGQPHLQIDL